MNPLRVLVVDDEEELVFALIERLRLRGIEAEGVVSGVHALRKIEQEAFDVVVLDVKMPGLSGMETMRWIKQEHPQTQVILVTGHGAANDARDSIAEGVFDYLVKPVPIQQLLKRIRDAAAARPSQPKAD